MLYYYSLNKTMKFSFKNEQKYFEFREKSH